MGFFKSLITNLNPPTEIRTVNFDRDWEDSWNALRQVFEQNGKPFETHVTFDGQFLENIWNAIESHEPKPQVAYSGEQQPINNVGESFRQDEIATFCNNGPGEDMPWLAGFLVPELANEFDKKAVAVYVVKPIDVTGDEIPFAILHAGYMDKESAHKVHTKILNLIGKDLFIPLLVRMSGGSSDKPNYGVFPYAMTDAIKFP